MNLVVDTSVWSLILRRRQVEEDNPYVKLFRGHVERGDSIHLVGMVLQELLDGVERPSDFEKLIRLLKPFPLIPIGRGTHILASRTRNDCRRKGVQASSVDFLIAAACIQNAFPLLTSDRDFFHIAKHCELVTI